jgi:Uma2 family endonuclease
VDVTADKLITAEEFLNLPEPPDGSRQELVRGLVITMSSPGLEHGECQLGVASLIRDHVKRNGLGRATVESGVRTERNPDTVRGPDVSFWGVERLPLGQRIVGYPEVPPDLSVEIVSPSIRRRELQQKIQEYLFAGVRMVWIIDPEDRTVEIYRNPEEGRVLIESATLDGEDVLPGFRCKVADLFA